RDRTVTGVQTCALPISSNVVPAQFSFQQGPAAGTSDYAGRPDSFHARLLRAAKAFVVRRGEGKTIIAGYPWFLDWGRDTLICARSEEHTSELQSPYDLV